MTVAELALTQLFISPSIIGSDLRVSLCKKKYQLL
jgi:hypothetical protein